MSSHELARKLLEGPDLPVGTYSEDSCEEIRCVDLDGDSGLGNALNTVEGGIRTAAWVRVS